MCAMYGMLPKRILIIEDDIDLLMLLERVLDKQGYAIETAASLPEGEEVLPVFSPDLVLLDININGDDGRKLCWKLKNSKEEPPVKVVLMSGYDYSTSRAVLFGADYMMPKPFHTDYLLHIVEQLLEPQTKPKDSPFLNFTEEME